MARRRFLTSFTGHNNWVRCVRFSPDGKMLVSCSDDKTIKLWDINSGQCIKTINELRGKKQKLFQIPFCKVQFCKWTRNKSCKLYVCQLLLWTLNFIPMETSSVLQTKMGALKYTTSKLPLWSNTTTYTATLFMRPSFIQMETLC